MNLNPRARPCGTVRYTMAASATVDAFEFFLEFVVFDTAKELTPAQRKHYVRLIEHDFARVLASAIAADADYVVGTCAEPGVFTRDGSKSLRMDEEQWITASEGTACHVVRMDQRFSQEAFEVDTLWALARRIKRALQTHLRTRIVAYVSTREVVSDDDDTGA